MIVYELTVGCPVFPKSKYPYKPAVALVLTDWRPDIPEWVMPATKELIQDCLVLKYRDRPSFTEILQRLAAIEFKLMAGVNSAKIESCVTAIENQEMQPKSDHVPG
jgi:hypothetical protein